jgi:adenine deaminase
MSIPNYAEAMLRHGTTATADGFYGQGLIGGLDAIKLMIEDHARTPLKLIFSIPAIAYLQNRELGIDPAPNSITAEQLYEMLDWPETDGIEEPPYLPIVHQDPVFVKLYEMAHERRIPVTGHAAGISLQHLNAYAAAGTISDHEQTTAQGAIEVARRGIKMMMRQGSGAYDVKELSKAITEGKLDPHAFSLCSDLAAPEKLFYQGDIDECIRVAVRAGIPPIAAIQMGTLSAAQVYRLDGEIGSIAPGKRADVVFVRDLATFDIASVMADGEMVVVDGQYLNRIPETDYPPFMYNTVILKKPVDATSFEVHANTAAVTVRAIKAVDLSLYTDEVFVDLPVERGIVQPDAGADVLRIAMIDRHGKTGNIGNGFVKGFGIRKGAVASSVNAVCENIVVVGASADDMSVAVNHLAKIGGGKVVVVDGKIVAEIELPLLGLLSEDPLGTVVEKFDKAYAELKKLGCTLTSPFATLEFCCACGEIGKLKIFDEGYINAETVERVGLIVSQVEKAA